MADPMSAEQARAELRNRGANMLPDEKNRLMNIAAGVEGPIGRQPMTISPFGRPRMGGPLQPEELAAGEDDEIIDVEVPQDFTLTLAGHRRVHFRAGVQRIPRSLLGHYYVQANGVRERPQRAGAATGATTAQAVAAAAAATGTGEPGDLDIPDDWTTWHHQTRISLARRLAPSETIDNAQKADEIIAAEKATRDRAKADANVTE